MEKVVEVPWDPEICSESNEKETEIIILASAIASGLLLTSILVTIGIVCYKRRGKAQGVVDTDRNPVYGTYSRGWEDDGEYGDGDVVELTDNNPVYGN